MSSTAWWTPAKPASDKVLSTSMKLLLSQQYLNNGAVVGSISLSEHDVFFLKGVEAAGCNELKTDARTLINAINKYSNIEIIISNL